jgi:hypothetical protein
MAPKIPAGLTNEHYKAALAEVITTGKVRIERARQAARDHLESMPGSLVGSTESEDGGNDDS